MFAIVVAEFNDYISKALLKACILELKRHGLKDKDMVTVWVPGALEIPLVAKKLAVKKNITAVICLGAIIRGETYHFDVVANESARGLMDVSLATGKPILNGILTADTITLAQQRAQDKGSNKGRDVAMAAMAMIALLKKIR